MRVCFFSYIFIFPYSLTSINHLRNPSVTTSVVCVVGSSGRPDRCAGATRLLTVRFNRYHPDNDLPVSRFATIWYFAATHKRNENVGYDSRTGRFARTTYYCIRCRSGTCGGDAAKLFDINLSPAGAHSFARRVFPTKPDALVDRASPGINSKTNDRTRTWLPRTRTSCHD